MIINIEKDYTTDCGELVTLEEYETVSRDDLMVALNSYMNKNRIPYVELLAFATLMIFILIIIRNI